MVSPFCLAFLPLCISLTVTLSVGIRRLSSFFYGSNFLCGWWTPKTRIKTEFEFMTTSLNVSGE
jgi:hypothetical protein